MTAPEPGVVYTTADIYNLPAGTHIRELGALSLDNPSDRAWGKAIHRAIAGEQ